MKAPKKNDALLVMAWYSQMERKKLQLMYAKLLLLRARLAIKTRNYVTSKCLPRVDQSAWQILWENGTDEEFINLTSLDRASFNYLLEKFKRHFNINKPSCTGRRGRPSKVTHHHQALGCLLEFYTGQMGLKNLAQIFGIPPGTLSVLLRKAEIALEKTLQEEPDAEVRWPTLEEQREWALKVAAKNPLVQGRWGFIDGKNIRVQAPTDADLQNAYYNGWLHAVLVTGTLCFGVDGTIVWFRHNCPGSWNDGETSRKFQKKLLKAEINLPGHGVLSDSAFPVSGLLFNKIITPLKEGELERHKPALRPGLAAMSHAITSMRQAAEWGMGAVEKVYRRLLLKLPYDQPRRALRLNTLFKLYNFRVRRTQISQIRTYFNSSYE
jgi:hypothetical protein